MSAEQNHTDSQSREQQFDQTEAVSNVLADAIEDSDPSVEPKIIDSQVDPTVFQQRIAELEGQVKEAKEAHARANAEAYNARNRMEQEAEKSKKFALERFARELLDVVDNLERAIASSQDDNDPVLEGVKLTHKSLLNVLEKNHIQVIDPQGEDFDADYHEAVGIDPQADNGKVGEVLQKGYKLHDRLLRPAMVRVGG